MVADIYMYIHIQLLGGFYSILWWWLLRHASLDKSRHVKIPQLLLAMAQQKLNLLEIAALDRGGIFAELCAGQLPCAFFFGGVLGACCA